MTKSHLQLAHKYWKEVVQPGDTLIDATCGNGHDTSFLAKLLKGSGKLVGYDIQSEAIKATKKRVLDLSEKERSCITLKRESHAHFAEEHAKLIVYNLGYLPGSDKSITTMRETTLESLKNALVIAEAISITCYPGHHEGRQEQEAIFNFLQELPSEEWIICSHRNENRPLSPTLIWMRSYKLVPSEKKSRKQVESHDFF